jgi:hypothetical protein
MSMSAHPSKPDTSLEIHSSNVIMAEVKPMSQGANTPAVQVPRAISETNTNAKTTSVFTFSLSFHLSSASKSGKKLYQVQDSSRFALPTELRETEAPRFYPTHSESYVWKKRLQCSLPAKKPKKRLSKCTLLFMATSRALERSFVTANKLQRHD